MAKWWASGALAAIVFFGAASYVIGNSYESGVKHIRHEVVETVVEAAKNSLPGAITDDVDDFDLNKMLSSRSKNIPAENELLIIEKIGRLCALKSLTHFDVVNKNYGLVNCPSNWRKISSVGTAAGIQKENYVGQESYYYGATFEADVLVGKDSLGRDEFMLVAEVDKQDLYSDITDFKRALLYGFLAFSTSIIVISFLGNKLTKKNAEQARIMALQSEEMKDIFERMDYGFVRVNLDLDPDKRKINFVNPAFCEMFGYKEEEVLGQSENLIIPDRYLKPHKEGIQNISEGGKGHYLNHNSRQTMYGLRKDGSEFPMTLLICEIETSEGPQVVGGIMDQTELMKLVNEVIKEKSENEKLTKQLEEAITLLAE